MISNLPLFPEVASTVAGEVDALFFFLIGVSAFFGLLIASLVVGFALPMFAGLLFFAGFTVLGQRDSMPYAFAVSSVLVTASLLKKRLFDLLPANTYITVTADHGELFGEGGYFGHGPIQHDKVFEVPLVEGQLR